MIRTRARIGLAAFAVCVLAGCGAKVVRERIYDKPGARVELRHQVRDDVPVPRGYAHPATIADVRIAHILASLSAEVDDGELKPLIRSQFVYELADGISAALAKAGPDDEVAAASFPQDRRLGIFTDERVTSFRLALVGDEMQIEFYSFEQPLEREGNKASPREYEIPTELPTFEPRFKIVAGTAQSRMGTRGVEVAWRDPYYRRPVSLSFGQGQARRRTVLMEVPPENEPAPSPGAEAEAPPNLSDVQLRALDQLDAGRQSGLIKESDYQRRRRLVLEHRLEEAGFGATPP
ncbi:MAG: hypothetical protein WEF50_07685 [Myxococcota bacterium]